MRLGPATGRQGFNGRPIRARQWQSAAYLVMRRRESRRGEWPDRQVTILEVIADQGDKGQERKLCTGYAMHGVVSRVGVSDSKQAAILGVGLPQQAVASGADSNPAGRNRNKKDQTLAIRHGAGQTNGQLQDAGLCAKSDGDVWAEDVCNA